MQKTLTRLFSKVLGSERTANKQQIVFHVENSDGVAEAISMPITESFALIEMIAARHGAALSAQGGAVIPVLPVRWFEFGRDQDKNLVLVLTLGSGGKLTFSIPRGLGSPMCEVFANNASSPPCEQSPDPRRLGDARPHLPQNSDEVAALA